MGRVVGGALLSQARIDAAPGLDRADTHALAGFVAAEAWFGIQPNNSGRNWSCALALNQRADDGAVLEDICRNTGLGHTRRVPARNTSRPQVSWTVTSKPECRELARTLGSAGLRGRKQREFEVWVQAVELWAAEPYGADRGRVFHRRMARLRAELSARRRYVDPRPPRATVKTPASHELLWFLGGFFSGEGCFLLSQSHARVAVKLRADDRPLLERFCAMLELGRVYTNRAQPPASPTATWTVYRQAELPRLIQVLDRAVLRGRKRREFEAWRVGAEEFIAARQAARKRDRTLVAEAIDALRDARRFVPEAAELSDFEDDADSAQRLYADLLRTWAAYVDGSLSCTRYARDRRSHPDWPTRTTIAIAFGGWGHALSAAGLDERRSLRTRRRDGTSD